MRGKLIVFEGIEGAGKTTQMQQTQDWLSRKEEGKTSPRYVIVTREPGGTALGTELRQLLLAGGQSRQLANYSSLHDRTELLLYAADRAQHIEEVLKPHLEQGAIILCDRYTDSTFAYQGYGRRINLNFIDQLNQIATGGLESDLTLWLDVEVEMGQSRTRKRGTSDRMEQADLAFHQRVQQGFAELATAYPQRIVRIDANAGENEVQQQIQSILLKWLF